MKPFVTHSKYLESFFDILDEMVYSDDSFTYFMVYHILMYNYVTV